MQMRVDDLRVAFFAFLAALFVAAAGDAADSSIRVSS